MYTQIPSALATPPQSPLDDSWSPNQAADMPLVSDLLARNGQLNVPPGFVLCIPCYLCQQPFNDIETFKEHLTQHAAEIHAWNTAQEQASQTPNQPMYQPFRPWHMQLPQQPPPPVVSIPAPVPGPIHSPMSLPIALSERMMMDQPSMQFPMQLQEQMPVQSPLEFPGHCSVHQPQPMDSPIHQRLHRSVPLTPQSPIEMMEHQFGYRKVQPIPQQHQPPMELHHKLNFMVQQSVPPPVEPNFMVHQPPPVELQRIVLKKPKEPIERHQPKEQPPQLPEDNLKDQFSIEKHLHIPPQWSQRIVLEKPQQPIQSPIEAEENNLPAERCPSPSPEEQPLANQRLLSDPPEKDQSKDPYMRLSTGRFQCNWCGKGLSSRQSVRYHQSRFHFMENPPTYTVSKKVQKHFKCTTCKKRYKRRTFLLMHMKIKHGICESETAEVVTLPPPATVESPVMEGSLSPERPLSAASSEGTRREVWSTKVFNAVAAANYSPATEPAAKYVNPPRQQSELPESGFAAKPKRVYPMRSPFFNPDLWLDCDAYF
ncbi:LOW QUALITY PROTEIN: bromodomain-containing protein 4 [Drosophila serrata]|uniref:LOW QUALITY PROTEIN: bromodomain-containing protein 4 n=1 Tax=Drosophila serrata TaxID=7274 RepID=UPI000A1D1DDD|nr:LOW QUALITY PROTEIN: bromodomain-containing protein 4 [Drosophila serrata]